MTLPATDTFTGTNGTALTTYSANWVLNFGNFAITSNAIRGNSASNISMAHWQADTFANNQYAQGTISSFSGAGSIGVAVRCASGATATGYVFYTDTGSSYLFKYVAGSFTQLATGSALANGNTMRLEVSGTTLSAFVNGALWNSTTYTDSSISTGYAGLGAYSNVTTMSLDSWEGGNLATDSITPALLRVPQKFVIDSWR